MAASSPRPHFLAATKVTRCWLAMHVLTISSLTSLFLSKNSVYFDADIATAANITTMICPTSYDWSCYTVSQVEDVDMCDKLTGFYSGQTCPSTGTYLYDFSLLLPGSLTRSMYWGSYSFEVRAIFVSTAGESTECSIAMQTVQSKYQMTLALTGFVALLAGAATLVLKQKRRRLNSTPSTTTGNEGVEFQMMRDSENGAALA